MAHGRPREWGRGERLPLPQEFEKYDVLCCALAKNKTENFDARNSYPCNWSKMSRKKRKFFLFAPSARRKVVDFFRRWWFSPACPYPYPQNYTCVFGVRIWYHAIEVMSSCTKKHPSRVIRTLCNCVFMRSIAVLLLKLHFVVK